MENLTHSQDTIPGITPEEYALCSELAAERAKQYAKEQIEMLLTDPDPYHRMQLILEDLHYNRYFSELSAPFRQSHYATYLLNDFMKHAFGEV
jgi:hypothetical protein